MDKDYENVQNASEPEISQEIKEELTEEVKEQAEEIREEVKEEISGQAEEAKEELKATYDPQSGTYSYVKTDKAEKGVDGCMWDNTNENKKQEKKSSKGFKVFAAVMLTVFALSAATIAVFMTADYLAGKMNAETTPVSQTAIRNDAPKDVEVVQLSAFAEKKTGLTKSEVAAKCTPSAVGIKAEAQVSSMFGNYVSTTSGSGFIYSSDGYIITNHHIIEDAETITVYLYDNTQHEAEVVGSDELTDIAVLKIDPEGLNLVPMAIGNSDALVVGDEVLAIGCPAGLNYLNTVTDGIISGINREVRFSDGYSTKKKTMTMLQTNATINRGNSGGALVNAYGEVVGINNLKLASDYENIGFSIPINGVLPEIKQIIEYGEVVERSESSYVASEGIIGISGSAITDAQAEYYDIPKGILVMQINSGSSAAKAGLKRGDIITAYNGKAVYTVDELNKYKSENKAGDKVTLSIFRDAENDSFEITFTLDPA